MRLQDLHLPLRVAAAVAASDALLAVALGFRGDMPRGVKRPTSLVAQVSTSLIDNLWEARLAAERARGQTQRPEDSDQGHERRARFHVKRDRSHRSRRSMAR